MILLASPSEKNLTRWEQAVNGRHPVFCSTTMDSLKQELTRIKPQMLLLDYELPQLNGSDDISGLMKLNPETKTIILSPLLSEEEEWGLFKTGIRGCCRSDVEPEILATIIESVQRGELWLGRVLSWHLLSELVAITKEKKKMEQGISDLLANLTRREGEIATLVGNGESNKQIARLLDITERTVKAHLTEVFRKLEITDRLKLALMVKGSITHLVSSRAH